MVPKGVYLPFWEQLLHDIPELSTLPAPLIRRIYHYLFVNSMTTQWFCTLHAHRLKGNEPWAGWYLAVATPVIDRLTDKGDGASTRMMQILRQPGADALEQVGAKLYQLSRQHHPYPEDFDQYLVQTLAGQEASLKQAKAGTVDESELREITWAKGGAAMLLYRSALPVAMLPGEIDAVRQLGGLMQLHNDIFDVYRDLQEQTKTLANSNKHINYLYNIYHAALGKVIRQFDALPLPSRQKDRFLLLLLLTVRTADVCLQQYAHLANSTDGIFQPEHYTRDQLICDMARPRAMWSVLKSTLQSRITN
jgi:hypothetical protein